MIYQHIKTAFRSFKSNWNYSLINALGLLIAFICSFVLITYTLFELSFDKFHENSNQIFRINELTTSPNDITNSSNVRLPVGPDFFVEFPEIENFTRIRKFGNTTISYLNNSVLAEKYIFADTSFFSMFTFKLLQGNRSYVLTDLQSIVLTDDKAYQLFKNENPIGKTVQLKKQDYVVTGICEKPPLNSHIQFDFVLPIQKLLVQPNLYFGWDGGISLSTFVQLTSGSNHQLLEEKIADFAYEKLNKKQEAHGFFSIFYLENLSKIHLFSKCDYDHFRTGNLITIISLAVISLVILMMAALNYVSISVGVNAGRKIDFKTRINLGAGEQYVKKQIFTETSIFITIVSIVALSLIIPFSNFITPLFGYSENFIIAWLTQTSIVLIPVLCGVILLISSSIYIRHNSNSDHTKTPKYKQFNIASLLQIFATVVLLVVVWGMQKQHAYALNKNLGFNDENVIFAIHQGFNLNQDVIKDELSKIPGVVSTTFSYGIPGLEATRNGYKPQDEVQSQLFNVIYADNNFLKTYDIQLIEGGSFPLGPDMHSNKILINETLAKRLGWENPIGRFLHRDGEWEIVGVVKDFHLGSIYEKIPPMLLSNAFQKSYYALSVKIEQQNIQQTIAAIEKTTINIIHDDDIDFSFFDEKFGMIYHQIKALKTIVLIFSLLALFISVLGIFGIAILSSKNRIKEIGIRKVNGARVDEILVLLNRNLLFNMLIAYLIAVPVAKIILSKWLNGFAYQTDIPWWIFAIAITITLVITLTTVSWQSWRAASRNPVEALRYE